MDNPVELLPCQRRHFIGNVDPMDLAEMLAHRDHKASRPTTDLERPAAFFGRGRKTKEFRFETRHNFIGSGQKLLVALLLPAKGDIVISVLPGPAVPVLTHLLQ